MERVIRVCDELITESIDKMDILNVIRDDVSKRILLQLYGLCTATLVLNALNNGHGKVNLQLAWERSLLNIETKYLGTFLRGLKYIDNTIPDDGQSERLMLNSLETQKKFSEYTEMNGHNLVRLYTNKGIS